MSTVEDTRTPRNTQNSEVIRESGERGFALMDSLMGAVLLGIMVMGTMQFFTWGQGRIDKLGDRRAIMDVALNQMEIIVTSPYDSVKSGTASWSLPTGETVTRVTTVTIIDDPVDSLGAKDLTGPNDYKKVVVEATNGTASATLRNTVTP